ncbi:MAG TPA: protein-L-isoaspartate(D-aspartate) O-methyltransferase [Kofleriaceae bacterium]|nr:protein-L-isoaspartate(D-aspartate) O-methyltransferase [Kofleriaceae bacterium]
MRDRSDERRAMVQRQIARRGIRDERVLAALREVPREAFVSDELAEFAYDDTPLPIEAGQTISQPYIVALMIEALRPSPGDRVLEIGAGSGYAAAVLSRAVGEVFAVERHGELAELARSRLAALGYQNVRLRHGDGSLGWAEHAPYQGIVVAAGGPSIPRALLDQLAVGGRLVMPVGPSRLQQLIRVTRTGDTEYVREDLSDVRFVPLIGEQGWSDPLSQPGGRRSPVARLVGECAEPIERIEDVSLASLIDRIGDARVVLLGESTHGTSEFYRMRARITRELVLRCGFRMVAVEADWPDAAAVDRHIRNRPRPRSWVPFSRFPTWMWRNQETHELVEWLYHYNQEVASPERQVSFHGLDLYSLYTSAAEVIAYLERVDPGAAAVARQRYGCLTPWQGDPAAYGKAALVERLASCEPEVVSMLTELLQRRIDGEELFEATQNAWLVADAERYYRIMYYGSVDSWNLRDRHMFDTLVAILHQRGPDSRAIVWEHNSHIGDAAATEMGARGEFNVGHLCRSQFADQAYAIGFGTDRGTVAAASEWGGSMEVMAVRPSHTASYERVCHDSGVPAFLLHLRHPARDSLRDELTAARLERAIGVIYRPDTELASHYFQAVLPQQFDEYVWFDETHAVEALARTSARGLPDTYPFGL